MLERLKSLSLKRPEAGLYPVIAVGASLGGISALSVLLSGLPADFPAPLLIVQHLSSAHKSYLPDILSRRSALKVVEASAGETIQPGTAYLAPPDNHLLVKDGCIELSREPPYHFLRPSIDLLLESVAVSFKHRTIAVILTGSGSDGSQGLLQIKQAGGLVIAQETSSAKASGMPDAAVKTQAVDLSLPLEQIAAALIYLVMEGTA